MPLAIHPLGINRPLWQLARVDLDEANALRILRIPQRAAVHDGDSAFVDRILVDLSYAQSLRWPSRRGRSLDEIRGCRCVGDRGERGGCK